MYYGELFSCCTPRLQTVDTCRDSVTRSDVNFGCKIDVIQNNRNVKFKHNTPADAPFSRVCWTPPPPHLISCPVPVVYRKQQVKWFSLVRTACSNLAISKSFTAAGHSQFNNANMSANVAFLIWGLGWKGWTVCPLACTYALPLKLDCVVVWYQTTSLCYRCGFWHVPLSTWSSGLCLRTPSLLCSVGLLAVHVDSLLPLGCNRKFNGVAYNWRTSPRNQ